MRTSLFVAAISVLTSLSSAARADVYCGSTNPTHDAPAGYLILSRAHTSVISGVINALSEYRTHTMLSHGSWFTHAVMATPPTSSTEPHMGPTELRFGSPGASQITSAAAYSSLYNSANGGIDFISKQTGGTEGETVASWFWSSMGYRWVPNRCGTGQSSSACVATYHPTGQPTDRVPSGYYTYDAGTYYDCNGNLQTNTSCSPGNRGGLVANPVSTLIGGGYYRLQENGADIPYSLHQFAEVGGVRAGSILASGDGVVCSTLISYGIRMALGRNVAAPYYTHALTSAAMTQFHDGVFNACKNSDFGFFGGIIDWFAFGSISDSKCDAAGNQGANCLINPAWCSSSGGPGWWFTFRDNAAVQAHSISPDGISGWRPGQNYGDSFSYGPWSPSNFESLSFSGGGTTYSCWGN